MSNRNSGIQDSNASQGGFEEGLTGWKQGGSWGYVDHSGKEVLKPAYFSAGQFSNGFAAVKFGKKDPNWVVIDRPGKALPSKFAQELKGPFR